MTTELEQQIRDANHAEAKQYVLQASSLARSIYDGVPVVALERAAAEHEARLLHLLLRVDTGEPVWSSDLLRRTIETVVSATGSSAALFVGLADAFVAYRVPLTPTLVHYIDDLSNAATARGHAPFAVLQPNDLAEHAMTAALGYLVLRSTDNTRDPEVVARAVATLVATPEWHAARALVDPDPPIVAALGPLRAALPPHARAALEGWIEDA